MIGSLWLSRGKGIFHLMTGSCWVSNVPIVTLGLSLVWSASVTRYDRLGITSAAIVGDSGSEENVHSGSL